MTRTKISPWTAGLALAVAGSLTFAGAAMAQQAQKLRLGIVIDVTKSLGGEFATTFANVAKEKSGGRVEVAIFDKGQLGGEKEMVASMQLGELDFALVNGALLSTVDPSYMATEMPFIWRTREQAHAAFDGEIGQKMRTQLEAKGIRV
ncbi:MAG: hypothetical protein FJX57_23470, partial [Alphaproteobacteria bacterium]|nr:hypothetical protein [Alphaproteobacteria bacterium]